MQTCRYAGSSLDSARPSADTADDSADEIIYLAMEDFEFGFNDQKIHKNDWRDRETWCNTLSVHAKLCHEEPMCEPWCNRIDFSGHDSKYPSNY